jgi:hypothetical protein
MLNWRPVYEIESEIEQLQPDNARLAVLNSKIDALLRRASPPSPLASRWAAWMGTPGPGVGQQAGWQSSPAGLQSRLSCLQFAHENGRPAAERRLCCLDLMRPS